MATFTATITIEMTIEVQCPDSKLKAMLTSQDYTDWIDDAISNIKASGKNNYVNAQADSFEVNEVTDICKDSGNSYEWDGEKLTKDS
jgi:hypothetical protein